MPGLAVGDTRLSVDRRSCATSRSGERDAQKDRSGACRVLHIRALRTSSAAHQTVFATSCGVIDVAGPTLEWFVGSRGFRPSTTVRLTMLAACYAPLLLLLAILNSFGNTGIRWVLAAVAVLSVAATMLLFLVAVRNLNAVVEQVYSATPREGESLKFFASYVVPFFVAPTAPDATRWALGLYLVIIAVLYLQGDMYFSNPVTAVLGYRLFELTREDRGFVLVLTRRRELVPGEMIRLSRIGPYIHVENPE